MLGGAGRMRLAGYRLEGEGHGRHVVRVDRKGLELHVIRGLHVTEEDRVGYADRSIFLDGVFLGPPFLDNVRRHYALDHHHGVVRPFTLATCEQAAVLVALGLPLREDRWSIYVNEPDLDALLAAWVLLQHDTLLEGGHARLRAVMPLLRVEGHIDTFGFELPELSALEERRLACEFQRLERLRRAEVRLRRTSRWSEDDPLAYALEALELFDRELLSLPARRSRRAEDSSVVDGAKVAVLIRSSLGIYLVEQALRIRFGDALARVVLERPSGGFSLLQCDPFLGHRLTDLYPLLDAADPSAETGDGHGWGGADDIGGSPRQRPSRLDGEQVLRLVARIDGLEEVLVRGDDASGLRATRPSSLTRRGRRRPGLPDPSRHVSCRARRALRGG